MKTLYNVAASILLLTTALTVGNSQNLSNFSASKKDIGYQERTNELDFAGGYQNDNINEESDMAQVQGYSHGIEYRSQSNTLNMMECATTRVQGDLGKDRVTMKNALSNPKYIAMSNVLMLSNQEAENFFPVYARYESDLLAVSSETADAERLLEKQQFLKDKYFDMMNHKSGPYLASRFLAWENYYSNTCSIK